jgi:hypothetical protein
MPIQNSLFQRFLDTFGVKVSIPLLFIANAYQVSTSGNILIKPPIAPVAKTVVFDFERDKER